ncbi:uncharacterized protein LOC128880378 isoform X1 [Hylaeus volcanicus]|uniref:uncharacterized protein LOC128880378 isoform X1 n=1 Tax=Hylaeus volcanicus TaxID=313075 RepID=UPI0023B83F79|nr:uncharacterized protein LOC128880378 isoform X1 [Hylaeus volcanicus]XP_053986382.1 uncharacterized protein LOC128880378 isoform X1 [Hylaeus volcanicus]XP_053986383.1 uncharacterized protein LOC128880378 isoform X1 [Hylaeus volcanicus]
MSGSGFRGRGFGPRGARSNGPTNGFTGPRFPFPNFNHPWPQHRLPGPEKWIEGPNFAPWQKNKNFVPRPHYRGNLQFRQNNRGRAVKGNNGRGRPSASQFCLTRNPGPRVPGPREEQVVENEKPVLVPVLPGSEEERQKKIIETADKLKQKLSSIKPEELTNFWEDDLSILPNPDFKEKSTLTKGIPELRHEPSELNLSYTDFRDIGKVDGSNKFDNVKDKINSDDIIITFEGKTTDASTNNEHIVINEDQDESLTISDSVYENDVLCKSNNQEEIFHNLPNFECNSKNLHLQCNNVTEIVVSSDENNADETLSVSNIDEKILNFTPTKPTDDLINEKSLDLDDVEVNTSQKQNTLELDKQNIDTDIIQVTNVDLQQNEHLESDLHQLQDNVPEEEVCQISANTSDSLQNNSVYLPPPSEDIQSNIVRDSQSPTYSIYNEAPKLNSPPAFQQRVFNVPPRFGPRIPGTRNRWPFQQNGNNLFFRGPQRLPFHGNRMPRIPYEYNPTDLVPLAFDPRAPPPFTHNVPATSHDSQHLTVVPFSTKDLPPKFDPSEPPPNIRTTSATEPSNRQEIAQTMPPLDSRNQTKTTPLNNMENMQPPAFDPRGPPPKISNVIAKTNENLPEFNPQQPPPKIHKRDETLQPPPIFDPRLSSQERSKLIAPLNPAGSHMMGMKIMETSQLPVLNITPVTANFSHPPPTMPTHQGFIPALPVNFPPVLSQVNSGQVMVQEFALPPPPINITEIPPLPPQEPLSEKNSNHHQVINMDDGLEDMQEAMEFAKEIMKMNQGGPSGSEASFTPSEIPVPIEDIPCLSINQTNVNTVKKQKKKDNMNKKSKQNIICGPELNLEKQREVEIMDEEESVQIQTKNIDDTILTDDQIRPKVVFNLNSKTKIIQKPEEWHRTTVNIPENKEASRYLTTQNSCKEKKQSKKYSFDRKRNNINQIKSQEKEYSLNTNLKRCCTEITKTPMVDKSNDRSHHQDYVKDSQKTYSYSLNIPLSNNIGLQKIPKSKKEVRKVPTPISESSWKGRVINRFLKMSKNDICNMVNNSSLRKFDIAMKHLVKEKRSSMSIEMRNTEDEKMKEYDREEFMNQLNAMLDPSAVVGISDLPTEFIHHLSEVLQLDPIEDTLENMNSSKKSLLNKSNSEAEATHKLQTPLFNEADLDDILSQVTERTRTPAQIQPVTKPSEDNAQFSNSTVADLDDIFSAGIARAKSLSKSADLANTRVRKSSSEDQIRFRSERRDRNKQEDPDMFRHEMWNNNHDMNNHQEDTFRSEKYEYMCRNLTKEEWEAKYGSVNATTVSTMRKTSSNSAENLNRDSKYCQSQRYYSSDSHMRRLSMSPLSHEPPAYDPKRCSIPRSNDLEDVERTEQSDSNSDSNTSSTSDTEEETVAPDVTKLLKVIKENEKIAKKKTLNETIRDEVAAEIEKKWMEKSKYKDRKLRKRDKRKRDRREKQKKRRRRNRNSHSDMSKTSEHPEEFRLLTEDEIKKEVVIKEEPLNTPEETIPQTFSPQTNTTLVVPATTYEMTEAISQIESQSLAIEKQQFPVITCNKMPPQIKAHSTAISVTMHPKTKAQLKQMPEFNDLMQKNTIKKPFEVVVNANTKNIEEQVEKDKGSEIDTNETDNKGNGKENKDGETDTSLPPNNSLPQLNLSLNVTEQSHTETTSDDTTNTASYNVINPVTEISISSHSSDQKAPVTSISSSETKSGYRKIDIKVYKERALQRRLKEEAKLNENLGVSVSLPYNSHDSQIKVVNEISTLTTMNKLRATEVDINKVQLKDPRLVNVKSTSQSADSSFLEIPNKEDTEKDSSTEKLLHTSVSQNNEQLLTPVQSKSANKGSAAKVKDTERLFTLPVTFELVPLRDSDSPKDSPKDHKCDAKPPNEAQEKIVNHELVDLQIQGESKVESVESKKLPTTNETNKFKNIRSEGSKELKLKKDKKPTEKKKKSPKSKSLIEKDLKHSNKAEIKKTENSSESEVRAENVAVEHINCRINKELINSDFTIVEKNDKRDAKNDEVKTDIDTRITENQQITNVVEDGNRGNQQITDQGKIEITDDKDLINLKMEENSVKEIGESRSPSFEVNGTSFEPDAIVQLDKKENKEEVKEEVFSFNNTQIQIYTANRIFSTENPCCIDQKIHSPKDDNDLNNSVKSDSNSTPDLRTDLKVLGDSKTKLSNQDDQDDDTSTSALKDLQTLDDFSKAEKDEVRSPDSTGSPFKGFLIEGDIKKPAIEDPKEWLKICLNEELDEGSRHEVEEMNEPASEKTSVEEQSSTARNDIKTSNIETVTKPLETRDNNTGVNQDNSSILESDSQGTFDENGEPFIVLDEYIDDTDDKSIEKLGNLDLDLDDCISKNIDIFSSRPLPEVVSSIDNVKSSDFNSIVFKQLSDVFDTDDLMSVEQAEESTSIDRNSNIKELSINRKQNSENNVTAVSQLQINVPLITEKNLPDTDISGNNLQHNFESSDLESKTATPEIPTTLNVAKTALAMSLENLSGVTASTPEMNVECTNPNEETSELNKKIDKESSVLNKGVVKVNKNTYSESSESNERVLETLKNAVETIKETTELNKKILDKGPISYEKSNNKVLNHSSRNKINSSRYNHIVMKDQKSSSKSDRREDDKALHKVRSKHRLKHKHQKKRNISKKAIEEAVESDSVKVKYPTTKEAIMARMIEIDVEIHKLMTEKMTLYKMLKNDTLATDQLIQNIDAIPVTNQCSKIATETVPPKDTVVNPVHMNKSKVSKHEHHAEKRARSFDDEEIGNTFKKRKKHKSTEKAKCDDKPESVPSEEKQSIDTAKLILKKASKKQETSEKVTEQIESQVCCDELVKLKMMDQVDETASSLKDSECASENLNDTDTASSVTKTLGNRTPERSSIYSDDSTWDSLFQAPSDDQKKPATGLALLEETYKKEIAKTRRIRIEARRRRKQKIIRNLQPSVNALTPEEEELPLSALYAKKVHHRKKTLSSLNQQLEKTNDDQQLWKNVDEVINAVAENRTEVLYRRSERRSSDEGKQNYASDVDNACLDKEHVDSAEVNSESKLLRREENVILLSKSKSQDLRNDGEQEDLVSVESQSMESSPTISSVQQTMKDNNLEIKEVTLVENLDDIDKTNKESNLQKNIVDIEEIVSDTEQVALVSKHKKEMIPSTSPIPLSHDEVQNSLANVKKNRCIQKIVSRKRSIPRDDEIILNQEIEIIKKCRHTILEMINCKVKLVDSKHTFLKPNVNPNLLHIYGISKINSSIPLHHMHDIQVSTSTPEFSRSRSPKLIKKQDDVTRTLANEVCLIKDKRKPKSVTKNLQGNDKEKHTDLNKEVIPVLTKEQIIVDISEDKEKLDIEIVTKNQDQNECGSTVIETIDNLPRTQYTVHKGPILDIKVFENSFLAASEDGRIYRYSQTSNGILNIYKGHTAAVTCLYVYNANSTDINKEWMFTGSLDGTLRCYNVTTGHELRDAADIGSPIQCMDEAWGIIFIGTKSGHVSRYHVKSGAIKGNSIQFSDKSVLALKATNEGPRRVLIVASRSQPITIRDAQNGLFLRTICGQKNHTVYSLMLDNNLIYCGTSTTSILVFDFTNGDQIIQYNAGVGIVCMRLYKQLLFAGCYDGNIYVFNIKDHRLVCSIPGPGNMLLSMEVIENKIIAGSKDKRLQSWQMAHSVRALL